MFAGLPGSGKTAIAEALARDLGIPIFSKDWLEATLWRNGYGPEQGSGWAAYELMSALSEQQLRLGQSLILDSVATTERIREEWRQIACRHRAPFLAIECVCSDRVVHRSRLEGRIRNIPGWPELTWDHVEEVRGRYEPWQEEHLVLDTMRPLEDNRAAALRYVRKAMSGDTAKGKQWIPK